MGHHSSRSSLKSAIPPRVIRAQEGGALTLSPAPRQRARRASAGGLWRVLHARSIHQLQGALKISSQLVPCPCPARSWRGEPSCASTTLFTAPHSESAASAAGPPRIRCGQAGHWEASSAGARHRPHRIRSAGSSRQAVSILSAIEACMQSGMWPRSPTLLTAWGGHKPRAGQGAAEGCEARHGWS